MNNYCIELLKNKNSEKFKKEKTKEVYDYLLKNVFKTTDFKITNKHVKETFVILDKIAVSAPSTVFNASEYLNIPVKSSSVFVL